MSNYQPKQSPGEPNPEYVIEATRFRPPSTGPDFPVVRVPWLMSGVVLILMATVWGAWFVLTARSVAIKAAPPEASVYVQEWPAPRVGDHWLLRPGKRRIRVEAPGYTTFAGAIDVSSAPLQTQQVVLVPLPGHLRIGMSPEGRAEVYVDGERTGTAPGVVQDIPAGLRRIELRAERYRSFSIELEIEGKGIEQRIDAVLEPAWADITVDTKPGSASVFVDQNLIGQTPLKFPLLEGRRIVELRKEGYKNWKQTLKVIAGNPVNLGEIVLTKADGRVRVDSSPGGANVTVNGEFHGRTPIDIALAPDKAHDVRLIKEGFKPVRQDVRVESGKVETVRVVLEAELATIHLATSPEQAELLIGGVPAGNATQTLSLPTHEHEITIRSPGYATYQTTITPRKGVEKRFKIRLKTAAEVAGDAQAKRSSRKGFITTFAGQEMKLFSGGQVIMGSSRRESARRANEIQREIQLKRPFYMSLKEVTNAEFRKFLANHESKPFKDNDLNKDELPVSGITWTTAATYCNWLSRRDGLPTFYQIKFGEVLGVNPDSTGYRLPTEAEWEWAARVPPNGTATVFPWGDRFPPRGRSGNYADASAANIMGNTLTEYTDGFAVAAPPGSFPPNLNGLYDMGGNVSEWTHDYYDAAPSAAPVVDPLGPATGVQHVIKGSSWAHGSETELRYAYRDAGAEGRDDVGFRLVRYAN